MIEYMLHYRIYAWKFLLGKKGVLITRILPYSQVQTTQFQVHISYFLQKCKKGKSSEMELPLLKNDITSSEPAIGITNIVG